MKLKTFAALCGTALLVSGCATQKDVELDQKKISPSVHRIAVIGPADPVTINVNTENEARAQRAVAAAAAIPFAGVLGAAIAGWRRRGNLGGDRARETSGNRSPGKSTRSTTSSAMRSSSRWSAR